MFLSWVVKCDLMQHPPEAHVLKGFDEKSQRGICSVVVRFLCTQHASETPPEITPTSGNNVNHNHRNTNAGLAKDPIDVLSTPTHIRWAMEALGHSFALGMEDADVITEAIRVYEKWLGLTVVDMRPKCMALQEQEFIRDLLGHMTLLFEEREAIRSKPDLLAKQVSLCQK